VKSKVLVRDLDDLSTAYSPGVAAPCQAIALHQEEVWNLTIKASAVAIVTDGSAVLGLGNIGPHAAIPVMEGKALLFKKFANIDGFPICLDTQDTEEIIETVKRIAPVFGGINLEDISAPRCFEIEDRLQDIGIPVFHDDQHGTAIVLLAALINASRLVKKNLKDLSIVINGAGAAGIAITKLLRCIDFNSDVCTPVKDVVLCDSRGAIHRNREDLTVIKRATLNYTNPNHKEGSLSDVLEGADVFIGVSQGRLMTKVDVKKMARDPIIFALANPIPEIMPDQAYKAGAAVVGTGRSDFPNQVNNVLAFPGIFRGALDARASRITPEMKLSAAYALADFVKSPTKDRILPSTLNYKVAQAVGEAVRKEAVLSRMHGSAGMGY